MTEPAAIEVHKALADDTRYRLYRYLRLSGRPVPIRELAVRLSLHPNTLRAHLRRLEEVGLVASDARRGAVGRPQVLYTAVHVEAREGRDYRLLGEILAPLVTGARQRERAVTLARDWGAYLVAHRAPRPGGRRGPGPDLAALREALAEAGFDPRFRRRGPRSVDIGMRDCPFRDLLAEHRELICSVHRGLLEGMLGAARPPLRLEDLQPPTARDPTCRIRATR
jgi:predicted ArsR family transcriptional regulator